jgi:hypothetical protein
LAAVLRSSSPERAYRLAPGDGRIAAALARNLLTPEASTQDQARANTLARSALRRDPTAVLALATLGLNAQARGDVSAARRAFGYAQKLTRRDLSTQLWAIEDAVARNDISGALDQYDITLRTEQGASDLLIPVLVNAIGEPLVRQKLVQLLAKHPPWANDFVDHAAAASSNPQATIALLNSMRQAHVQVPALASARVIDALVARGDTNTAWQYYASLHPGANRQTSRDTRFTMKQGASTRFDWKPADDADLTVSLETSEKGGRFDFATSPGAGGPVLRQMQVLPQGDYLIGGGASIEQANVQPPYWLLACVDGRELGRINIARAASRFEGRVRVPSDCPVQELSLVVRPSEQMASVAGQVTEIWLRPAVKRP